MKKKFDLKSFITVSITLTFCFLTIYKMVKFKETDIKDFMTIATMIYMFYFQKKEGDSNDISIAKPQSNITLSGSSEQLTETQDSTKE